MQEWKVRTKPNEKRMYQVVAVEKGRLIVAETFGSLVKARAFADAANEMLGRRKDV